MDVEILLDPRRSESSAASFRPLARAPLTRQRSVCAGFSASTHPQENCGHGR